MEEAREHPALAELARGNARFRAGRPELPRAHAPRYAVLACADARVDPARIFGAEPGALFVVRTAGNVACEHARESLAFAAALGVKAVVVLGHSDCGAVKDALSDRPRLAATAAAIRAHLAGEDEPGAAARAHARRTAEEVRQALGGKVPVLAAYYRVESGEVEWLA